MTVIRSVITGCGSYLPEHILTNKELEKKVDTTDEWIIERTGIERRHIAAADELTSDLAVKAATEALEHAKLKADDIAWLVPHQANLRIIDATADRMGLDKNKVMINIQKYGNTTSGTLPLCLWEWESQLKKGDNIILSSFGGGFTWGSIYLKWAYDTEA